MNDFASMIEHFKAKARKGSTAYQDAVALYDYCQQSISNPQLLVDVANADQDMDDDVPKQNIQLTQLDWKDDIFRVGDFIYIRSPTEPSKPTIGQIFKLWQEPDGAKRKGFNACVFLRPEQTVQRVGTMFFEKEVFKTNQNLPFFVEDILGRCWVMILKDYIRGRIRGSIPQHTYVTESRYNDATKVTSKIKNWTSCQPFEMRGVEIEIDLFKAPIALERTVEVDFPEDQQLSIESVSSVQEPLPRRNKKRDLESETEFLIPGKRRAAQRVEYKEEGDDDDDYIDSPKPAGDSSASGGRALRSAAAPVTKRQYFIPQPSETTPLPKSIIRAFDNDGTKLKWFSAPPLDVVKVHSAEHTLEYLYERAKLKLSNKQSEVPESSPATKAINQRRSVSPVKQRKQQRDVEMTDSIAPSSGKSISKEVLLTVLDAYRKALMNDVQTIQNGLFKQ